VNKILKKYDKVMNDNLKETHIGALKSILPFWDGTPELESSIESLVEYFAHFFCADDTEEALRRMKLMIRELVTFQRHSVWLDVIEDHRKHESAQMMSAEVQLKPGDIKKPSSLLKLIRTSTTLQLGMVILATFVSLLTLPGIFDNDPAKRNALAMFVFVSLLWAAEVFPLFVTAMFVPFLTVLLRVMVIDGNRLDARAASKHVFAAMFSHVIMLLIGGFSIAAALSKHNIAKVLAASIAKRCGSGIRTVLMVNIFIATIASMWISNVAAPVLCYSLIAPILKAATAETSRAAFGTSQQVSAERDHRLCRALVLGIALASNVGGMASPISSPQNLFAIEYTPIGWVSWFLVSIPLCIVLNLMIWVWLIFCYQLPSANSAAVAYALQRDRSGSERFTGIQYYVIAVSVGVVLLWCASVHMEGVTGEMGVLGIVPFILFFGTGALSKEDLNNFLWSVVILAMGGLVLGQAVESSGLLDIFAKNIADFIEDQSLTLWVTLCIFTSLILFCTTFVSHTVGAIVVLPIAQAVGAQMVPTSHAKELVFAGALACSAAMGLPVSGFPNMTAVSVEDNLGNRFVTTKDFLKYAVPASIFAWLLIVTLAYKLILFAVEIDKH
jgi:phosphate transporter